MFFSEKKQKRARVTNTACDFKTAFDFAREVGDAAEEEGHHPLMEITRGEVTISWWTHKLGGLHANDFIMAAKTDWIYKELGYGPEMIKDSGYAVSG